ncbi:hypothetical protein CNMCM6805_009182 [Aspergillus fumigatiaffinis]|uniref:Reverse transcriptase domain-containing protein n=1 Tax=Aspergillus fumigatiaffinis TaxID=340414 RepID=A0A8H4H2R1_9EURO|nr:hypothetical protein CNMCM6805_009182 [Aspergillus fumigatiaffinis]
MVAPSARAPTKRVNAKEKAAQRSWQPGRWSDRNPRNHINKETNERVTTQELRRLIEDLKEVITNQSKVIQEIKVDQQAIKSQNVELQKQIHTLREQLEAAPATKTGTKSWAEIAAAASQQGWTGRTKRPRKELNCVRISTQRKPDEDDDENGGFRRYLPTDMASAKIRSALLSSDTTKDTQVAGVGTTKTGYVIRFRDAQSAEMARSNTTWLEKLGNETKLVKPRFGVVVHRVPTEDFDLDNEKKHGIQKILEENDLTGKGFEIEDVAWLKKKDRPLGRSASMSIWLNTPEAAESIINNGLLKPSPYSKRWFTPGLKIQQVIVNQLRRNWQESCANLGATHPVTAALFQDMRQKRREWTRTIEKAKATHWKEFLDAKEGHLWKAATYMRLRDQYSNIPTLRPRRGWDPNPMALGYYPDQWKRARIVVLRKPGKPDYTVPEAYRPISLLNTLEKILEAVMARRLSFWAENHKLLPDTQFGGRPGRNTEQALLVLANAIDRAWQRSKVVTLIAIDLKGAFNGVKTVSLNARLEAKGIPATARKWINSFMENRYANITFDDFHTEVSPLENAGLAQGSPLSPILFGFFNSDLVDQPVDYHGGSSAFIDDYLRWRAGPSAEDNIKKIQEEVIPRIEAWARRTGSSFAAEKTELIHLTRTKKEQGIGQITINGRTIKPANTAMLLGVIFDKELRWKEHVQQAVKRATKTNLSLGGLRHLRPERMRQLYQACVVPIVDYASSVWHNPLRDKIHLRTLGTVQRTALIRILSTFKTIVAARLSTLPRDHPAHAVVVRAATRSTHVGTGARFPLAETLRTMDLNRLQALETISPRPQQPWQTPAFTEIDIEPDREKAMDKSSARQKAADITISSDASGQHNEQGVAAVALDQK